MATELAPIFNVSKFDPAKQVPGAPPLFGQDAVPHVYTSLGRYGLVSQSYLNADEATDHSKTNANRMRVDCGIMEPLEARQRSTAMLNWHIEPEDKDSSDQKLLAEQLTQIVARTKRFTELRRSLLEASWYGRYAVALRYGAGFVQQKKRLFPVGIEPRHGDKLVFRYDDGSHRKLRDQVGIRIGARRSMKFRLAADLQKQVEPTEHGLVYWLTPQERRTLVVHKHHMEDSPFEDPDEWPIPKPFDKDTPAGIFACYLQNPCNQWHGMPTSQELARRCKGQVSFIGKLPDETARCYESQLSSFLTVLNRRSERLQQWKS